MSLSSHRIEDTVSGSGAVSNHSVTYIVCLVYNCKMEEG